MLSRTGRWRTDTPAIIANTIFVAAVLIQLAHSNEHLLQLVQKYIQGRETYPGLLGVWFDFEWVHVLFNGALWLALFSIWLIYRKNPGIWRPHAAAETALNFVVIFQGYHWVEHLVRIWQYLHGVAKPKGLLGQVVPLLELHFWFNAIVVAAMITAFVGFRAWRIWRPRHRRAVASEAGQEAVVG